MSPSLVGETVVITQEYLKSILDYDESTGEFYWKKRLDKRVQWNARYPGKKAGCLSNTTGYIQIAINDRLYRAHRLAWQYVYGIIPNEIDHINLNKIDNRINNLRECDSTQNKCNFKMHKDNKSGYKGVSYSKLHKKWITQIVVRKKHYHIGLFDCPKDAHLAYCQAAKKYHGEFARTV